MLTSRGWPPSDALSPRPEALLHQMKADGLSSNQGKGEFDCPLG